MQVAQKGCGHYSASHFLFIFHLISIISFKKCTHSAQKNVGPIAEASLVPYYRRVFSFVQSFLIVCGKVGKENDYSLHVLVLYVRFSYAGSSGMSKRAYKRDDDVFQIFWLVLLVR